MRLPIAKAVHCFRRWAFDWDKEEGCKEVWRGREGSRIRTAGTAIREVESMKPLTRVAAVAEKRMRGVAGDVILFFSCVF